MKIKASINLSLFLNQIKLCSDDVTFETNEGDCLNLKSTLSTYIFATLTQNPELLSSGHVICKNEKDFDYLKDFLEN